jgi:hypothetical protein
MREPFAVRYSPRGSSGIDMGTRPIQPIGCSYLFPIELMFGLLERISKASASLFIGYGYSHLKKVKQKPFGEKLAFFE